MDPLHSSVVVAVVAVVVLACSTALLPVQQIRRYYRPAGVVQTLVDPRAGAREAFKCMYGPEDYCYGTTRLKQPVFRKFVKELEARGAGGTMDTGVSVAEQAVIFLDFLGHNQSMRQLRRTYQHSFRTFHIIIKRISKIVCSMSEEYIQMPSQHMPPPPHKKLTTKEKNDTSCSPFGKFYWFKNVVGAIDGTLLPMNLPEEVRGVWNSRKGTISQNAMAACDLDIVFQFVLVGYEGSAPDGTVLKKAYKEGFDVPPSRYYLADGGYSAVDDRLLVPYEKTRYHIREQRVAQRRPETKEELFNLRHAQLRNVVKRVFGVLKKRFPILAQGAHSGYSIREQTRFILCCFVLHNFILLSGDQPLSSEPDLLGPRDEDSDDDADGEDKDGFEDLGDVSSSRRARFRDEMAKLM